ncbi:MAG TPA: RNA methyltransferase [Prolixibacteraceae bacterium]|nr:RNA methyltransferase [Prolixibacteraceae bacterium]
MAYNQQLANRIREQLQYLDAIQEKEMMGGIAFMLNDKMCVGVIKDEMMCRIDPARYEDVLDKTGCHEMLFTGKPMKGWVMIEESGLKTAGDFDYWIGLALDYNQHAKSSKKKK